MTIPFTLPYTSPDGTTRRPLADRVPECVPRYAVGPPSHTSWGIELPCEDEGAVGGPVDVAAALWRVAVEDWLLNHSDMRMSTMTVSINQEGGGAWTYRGDGPDLLHALNAAAHAVADALGVER